MQAMAPTRPLFAESLDEYLARAPEGATQASWSSALDAAYAEWKARPFRWTDGTWRAEPEPPVSRTAA